MKCFRVWPWIGIVGTGCVLGLVAAIGLAAGELLAQSSVAAVATSTSPQPAGEAADWPRFHGPKSDSICTETGLLTVWPKGGPPLVWKLQGLGKGYSTVSIADGKFFTMGDLTLAAQAEAQYAMAFDLSSRKRLWATRVGPPHQDGPRSTPTVDGQRVYCLGTEGELVCLEVGTGVVCWQKNLVKDFGGKMMSGWKYSESPLIDGPRLLCTPGGSEAMIVALDKLTGEPIWRSAMPSIGKKGKDGAGYASMVVAETDGVRQYVQMVGRGVISVEAQSGRFLWGYNKIANSIANITAPMVHGNQVFCTTSYKTGSALLDIRREGDRFQADEVYYLSPAQFENHHGGVVLVGDYIYGGGGQNAGKPVCFALATGMIAWTGKPPDGGSAAVLYADGHIYFRFDRGTVALVEATPKGFHVKSTFKPLMADGPAWAHPVIHNGKLYLRHNDLLACYDLRRK